MIVKIVGVMFAAVVLVIAIGASVYFGIGPFSSTSPPEHSARYYPPSVLAYFWLTLDPGEGQRGDMIDIFSRFREMDAFEDQMDDSLDDLEDEIGIDFEDDVLPWIGEELSFALFDLDTPSGVAEVAMTIDVRDRAAADFMDDWLDYAEDTEGADFRRDSEGDFDVWEDESANQIYALSEDLLVFATTRDAMDDVLRRVAGETERTLAAHDRFQEARAAMPSRRFASVYVDYEELIGELFETWFLVDAYSYENCLDELLPAPDWMAGSLGWVERGIVMDFVSPSSDSLDLPDPPDLSDAAAILPDDTMGFLSLSFDPALDSYRSILADYDLNDFLETCPQYELLVSFMDEIGGLDRDSTFADLLDYGLDGLDDLTGIDIESDLLDLLSGQLVLSIEEFDFRAVNEDASQVPIRAAAALSYKDAAEQDLRDTVDDLTEVAGFRLDEVDVGAERPALVYPLEGTQYEPGIVFNDGYMTVGTTRRALEDAVAAQSGGGDSLSSDSEYRRAVSHLPADRQWLLYADLRRIVENTNRDDAGLSRDQYAALKLVAGAVAASFGEADGFDRITLSLTLFPDS